MMSIFSALRRVSKSMLLVAIGLMPHTLSSETNGSREGCVKGRGGGELAVEREVAAHAGFQCLAKADDFVVVEIADNQSRQCRNVLDRKETARYAVRDDVAVAGTVRGDNRLLCTGSIIITPTTQAST